MDGDIPHADLDRLPSPESSSYQGRQGTGRENPPSEQRKACNANNLSIERPTSAPRKHELSTPFFPSPLTRREQALRSSAG